MLIRTVHNLVAPFPPPWSPGPPAKMSRGLSLAVAAARSFLLHKWRNHRSEEYSGVCGRR